MSTQEGRSGGRKASDYKKLQLRNHIYTEPDMYACSAVPVKRQDWIYDTLLARMVLSNIGFPPIIERVYLEILDNASDAVGYSRRGGVDPEFIKITMDNKTITISNGGYPIPVEIHEEEGVYIPELIFGNLLTSSNYRTTRKGIGKNGYGGKLTNIFAHRFTVRDYDSIRHLFYTQTWTENMIKMGVPEIADYDGDKSYVEISYDLDFTRFGISEEEGYSEEVFGLFERHAADLAYAAKIPVHFNGKVFDFRNIRDYGSLYVGDDVAHSIVHYEWPPHTKVVHKKGGVQISEDPAIMPIVEMLVVDAADKGLMIPFVNCLISRDGGVHADAAIKAIASHVVPFVNSGSGIKPRGKGEKKSETTITLADIRPHVTVILFCQLDNPTFTSQSKTKLESPAPKITLTEEEFKPMREWGMIDRLYATISAKEYVNLCKTDGSKRRHIESKTIIDANFAGKARSADCVLCGSEGNSGEAYITEVVTLTPNGRDTMGQIPLRGKGLNATNASLKQIMENKEIVGLKMALGLREGVHYSDEKEFNTLRYGSFLMFADADDDGYHIIGLLLDLFHERWPSLLSAGFFWYWSTPVIRVKKGKQVLKFYSYYEYEEWLKVTPDAKTWTVQYYKGLGTSSSNDIKDDYHNPRYIRCFYDANAPKDLQLAFNGKLADMRKNWMSVWSPALGIEGFKMQPIQEIYNERLKQTGVIITQPISWFINNEFIRFSIASTERSIPGYIDGLKISQRKMLWAAINKFGVGPLNKQYKKMKVGQLSYHAAEVMRYHHGELCLSDVIVKMAQNFVGANNLAYFVESGRFGTRLKGGKDAAQPRYSDTYPEWWIPYVFRQEDRSLLEHLIDEDEIVEPKTLYPIIPMAVVNGFSGVGTAWSTFGCKHHPMDVVDWLEAKIRGEELPRVLPWYKGFTGEIYIRDRKKKNEQGSPRITLDTYGIHTEKDEGKKGKTIIITELPLGVWSHKYRLRLEKLRKDKFISDFRDLCGSNTVHFELYKYKGVINSKNLGLKRSFGLTNMVLLDDNNKPQRFETTLEYLEIFYAIRLRVYERRRQNIMATLRKQLQEINDKKRFVHAVITKKILVLDRARDDVHKDMDAINVPRGLLRKTVTEAYTTDKIAKLEQLVRKKEEELAYYENVRPETLWLEDLEEFRKVLEKKGDNLNTEI